MATLAIIGLLLLVSLGGFQKYQRRSNIGSVTHEVIGYLDRARVLSTVSYNTYRYGIHFEQGSYTLFRAPTYQQGAAGNEVRTLTSFRFANPNVFDNGQGGTTQNVIFSGLAGTTQNTGTIRLESTADSTFFKLLTINGLGTVTIQ